MIVGWNKAWRRNKIVSDVGKKIVEAILVCKETRRQQRDSLAKVWYIVYFCAVFVFVQFMVSLYCHGSLDYKLKSILYATLLFE